MEDSNIFEGKRILIVDDEPDVLASMIDLLDMCNVDTAPDFESAEKFIKKNNYDIAIFDIMGVRGYDLLALANQKKIPVFMFTAHALNPEAFMKSMKGGAKAYIPKEKMSEIATYVTDFFKAQQTGIQRPRNWFDRLELFFEKQFGTDWLKKYRKASEKFDWLDFDD